MNFLIFEDHAVTALGVEIMISQIIPDAKTQCVNTFPEGIRLLNTNTYDFVILDIDIPDGEGMRMISRIHEIQNHIKILVHSGYDEKFYALSYLTAGAAGFISKQAGRDEFKAAVKSLSTDEKYLSEKVKQSYINDVLNDVPASSESDFLNLSSREMEVMQLINEGKWTNEIADILNLKPSTVSTYKSRLYAKLRVTNDIELSKKISLYKHQ